MSLILPAGVRLAHLDELPGPPSERDELWLRIKSANITPGYVAHNSNDSRFSVYVEANIDAPKIWPLFKELCRALIRRDSVLLLVGNADEDPQRSKPTRVESLIQVLEPHAYQLANDGYIQVGIIEETQDEVNEILIVPTKHFKIWAKDRSTLEHIFQRYSVRSADSLEFLDQYPRTTVQLPQSSCSFSNELELMKYVNVVISGRPN